MNRVQLKHLVEKGSKRALALSRTLENPEWFLSTALLGTNLSTISINAIATLFVLEHFGEQYEYLTILFTFPLVLIFGEALPKAIYQRFADRMAPWLIYPLRVASWILSPLVWGVALIAKLSVFVLGVKLKKKTPLINREELELVFQASERRYGVKDLERRMVDRVFDFSDRQAREIMIPLVKLVSIQESATLAKAAKKIRESGYSRLPVFGARVDDFVGWINHYDLLRTQDRSAKVRNHVRKLRFVPATIPLGKLLVQMQKSSDSFVMLVNEYGGVEGMVTLEDVLEEIVGDIEDEYDAQSFMIRKVEPRSIVVNAKVPLEKLNDLLPQPLPEGEYETLAGFLLNEMQKVPQPGEKYFYRKYIFQISKASDRSIEEVEILL